MSLRQDFEARVLPHLDAGYNLARWLMRNEQAAEDAVQEAALRAMRYAGSQQGEDAKPWWLGIVRNTCLSALARQRRGAEWLDFDEAAFEAAQAEVAAPRSDPLEQLADQRQRRLIDAAIQALSPPLREVLVLREFEELDYAQIASTVGIPLGTVMSRLARAREKLRLALAPSRQER